MYAMVCLGPVPAGVDLHGKLQAEKERERQMQTQQHRQRRMSDSAVSIPNLMLFETGH